MFRFAGRRDRPANCRAGAAPGGVARRSASRPTSPGPRLVAARAAARQFELVLRRDSTHPNDLWQADHTDLDVRCSMRTAGPESIWVLTSITRARSFALT